MTYRGHVRNGQITLDEPVRLPEGAEVNVHVLGQGNGNSVRGPDRRHILHMSLEQRRQVLSEQSERLTAHHAADTARSDWQGGDIIE